MYHTPKNVKPKQQKEPKTNRRNQKLRSEEEVNVYMYSGTEATKKVQVTVQVKHSCSKKATHRTEKKKSKTRL